MKIINYRYGGGVKHGLPELALALGFFDGVHLGHRELIRRAAARAQELALPLGVFTFPAECYAIKSSQSRLYSTPEKLELLENLGVEYVILADFDSVSGLEPADFVTRVLVCDLNCRLCALGYNFRFGNKASGDAGLMEELLRASGRECLTVEEQKYLGNTLSASVIRDSLAVGDVSRAAEMLGLPFHLTGQVEHGLGLGRTLGFPTVNTPLPDGSPIKSGVYLTAVPLSGKMYPALTNVGSCPTFGERAPHAETTLLDFSGDLYGERLRIYFLRHLRGERAFSSAEELTEQIKEDIKQAKKAVGEIKWQEIGLS